MRILLNIIWLVLSGFWLFLGYALAALVMFILIVTIPWGIAAWRIGVYSLWPFGKTVVDRPNAGGLTPDFRSVRYESRPVAPPVGEEDWMDHDHKKAPALAGTDRS